ncbi:hypothetical protein M1506_01355 [Patescibacteria group bacterium]|nr:hypothetical protein [Patescibacteria group bacterium]
MIKKIRGVDILSWSISVPAFWFGWNEIFSPSDWVAFVPQFLGEGSLASVLVIFHGFVLVSVGLSLILNYKRKYAGLVFGLMLLEIIVNLSIQSGFSSIVIRDMGLMGASFSLFFFGL